MRAYRGLTATATSVAFRPEDSDGRGGSGQGSLVCGGEDGIMWLLDAAKAGGWPAHAFACWGTLPDDVSCVGCCSFSVCLSLCLYV